MMLGQEVARGCDAAATAARLLGAGVAVTDPIDIRSSRE